MTLFLLAILTVLGIVCFGGLVILALSVIHLAITALSVAAMNAVPPVALFWIGIAVSVSLIVSALLERYLEKHHEQGFNEINESHRVGSRIGAFFVSAAVLLWTFAEPLAVNKENPNYFHPTTFTTIIHSGIGLLLILGIALTCITDTEFKKLNEPSKKSER